MQMVFAALDPGIPRSVWKSSWAILCTLLTQPGFVDELLILHLMMDTLWFDLLVHRFRYVTLFSVLLAPG